LVTDALATLHERGLLVDAANAAYAWGGQPIVDLAHAGRVSLRPIEETHDLTMLSAVDRFVSCNTALQVGLDGSANVELVGGRFVAGVGGHADFCTAASRSTDGISLIALASTTRSGASTIVPRVERVSTARTDIEVVVTEHGIADLRGIDDAQRCRRIIAVAAPEHREWLESAADDAIEPSPQDQDRRSRAVGKSSARK
jgi:acyl-CoA hydrolase